MKSEVLGQKSHKTEAKLNDCMKFLEEQCYQDVIEMKKEADNLTKQHFPNV